MGSVKVLKIMNESTVRTFAETSSVKGLEMLAPMGVRGLALCAVLVFGSLPGIEGVFSFV
jgi:hypothetical protein